jgi:flagellar export protein FliJ
MNAPDSASLQRLATLQRLAEQQEETAARQLSDALAQLANAEDRCAELRRYELEYLAQPPRAFSVAALRHHAGFVARLAEAVRYQTERSTSLAQEAERARSRWVGLHREVEKLDQLTRQVRETMRQAANRSLHRTMDEHGQLGWQRQQAFNG